MQRWNNNTTKTTRQQLSNATKQNNKLHNGTMTMQHKRTINNTKEQ